MNKDILWRVFDSLVRAQTALDHLRKYPENYIYRERAEEAIREAKHCLEAQLRP